MKKQYYFEDMAFEGKHVIWEKDLNSDKAHCIYLTAQGETVDSKAYNLQLKACSGITFNNDIAEIESFKQFIKLHTIVVFKTSASSQSQPAKYLRRSRSEGHSPSSPPSHPSLIQSIFGKLSPPKQKKQTFDPNGSCSNLPLLPMEDLNNNNARLEDLNNNNARRPRARKQHLKPDTPFTLKGVCTPYQSSLFVHDQLIKEGIVLEKKLNTTPFMLSEKQLTQALDTVKRPLRIAKHNKVMDALTELFDQHIAPACQKQGYTESTHAELMTFLGAAVYHLLNPNLGTIPTMAASARTIRRDLPLYMQMEENEEKTLRLNCLLSPFRYLFEKTKTDVTTLTSSSSLQTQLLALKNKLHAKNDPLAELRQALKEFTEVIETHHALKLPKPNDKGHMCFDTYNNALNKTIKSTQTMPFSGTYVALSCLINEQICKNNAYPEYAKVWTHLVILELLTLSREAIEEQTENSATQWFNDHLNEKHSDVYLREDLIKHLIQDMFHTKTEPSAKELANRLYHFMLNRMEPEQSETNPLQRVFN